MPFRLGGIIANLIPVWLFRRELVKLVLETGVGIQGIRCDGESGIFGENFSKRRSADFAEASSIFVRGVWLKGCHIFLAVVPFQVITLHKNDSAGPCLPASGTMACPHHGWRGQQFEFHGTTVTATLNHNVFLQSSR